MVVMTIHMHALPAKRGELVQTLQGLMNVFWKEQGFLRAQLWAEVDDKNVLTLCEEWNTQDDVDRYMGQSEYFRVLLGAQQLLTSSSKMTSSMVSLGTISLCLILGIERFSSLKGCPRD